MSYPQIQLTNIQNQKMSYARYDSDYVSAYKENKTDFDTVMADITKYFGLAAPTQESADQMGSVLFFLL